MYYTESRLFAVHYQETLVHIRCEERCIWLYDYIERKVVGVIIYSLCVWCMVYGVRSTERCLLALALGWWDERGEDEDEGVRYDVTSNLHHGIWKKKKKKKRLCVNSEYEYKDMYVCMYAHCSCIIIISIIINSGKRDAALKQIIIITRRIDDFSLTFSSSPIFWGVWALAHIQFRIQCILYSLYSVK